MTHLEPEGHHVSDAVRRPGAAQPHHGGTGLLWALVASAAFGTSGTFVTPLIEAGWSTGAAVVARVGIASLVLAVPAAVSLRGRWRSVLSSWRMVLMFGLLAVAGCQWFYFNAVAHLSVGVALMLEYLGTVLVVGWLWVRRGQRPRPLTVIGAAVAIFGLVFVLDLIGGASLDAVGVIWGLAAAVGLASFFVLAGMANDDLPPLALSAGGLLVGAVGLGLLGLVRLVPMHVVFTDVQFAGHQVSWIVPILGLSVLAAAFAYVAGIGATRRLGAKVASFVGLTEVLFAIFFAWLLLGELPTGAQLAGGVLVVAGVALVRWDELRGPVDPMSAAIEPTVTVTSAEVVPVAETP
jgi:drug/metabolite transporter (DMT)-like permease